MLSAAAGGVGETEILPMPVDERRFSVRPASTVRGRIGFTGRIDDPRKNVSLLLEAVALLKGNGDSVSAMLVGGKPTEAIMRKVESLGLLGIVDFVPRLTRDELAVRLQTFDVFVLPSHQEGLCISALEAMACGVPVVSTRCGGPEEFVLDGQTGYLVDSDPEQLAKSVKAIIDDRALRARLSDGAREIVEARYGTRNAEKIFMDAFREAFPHLAKEQAEK
jgi:glycosyltransferase involved in cell wall biosynthesis